MCSSPQCICMSKIQKYKIQVVLQNLGLLSSVAMCSSFPMSGWHWCCTIASVCEWHESWQRTNALTCSLLTSLMDPQSTPARFINNSHWKYRNTKIKNTEIQKSSIGWGRGHIYAGTSELAPHEAITAPTAQYPAPGSYNIGQFNYFQIQKKYFKTKKYK